MFRRLTINIILLISMLGAQNARVHMEKNSRGFEGTVRTELNVDSGGLLEIENLTGDLILEGSEQDQFICLENFRVKIHDSQQAEKRVG